MDNLRESLERRSYALSAFDMQGSFANIPYAFFYENTSKIEDFMPTTLLKKSLAEALKKFPILTGHIRPKAVGSIEIQVDPANINFPEFQESANDTISFSGIKAQKFSWSSWPDNVATVGGFATPSAETGEIKLLNVHVLRLKDNSGLILFINIPHYAVDGAGYFGFIRLWADQMSTMLAAGQQDSQHKSTSSTLIIDRHYIYKHLSSQRRPVDEITKSIYSVANLVCDTLAWLSPTLLGRLLSVLGGLSSGEAHLFHVSRTRLDELKKSTQTYLPEGSRISDNDVLVGLLSKTYVQSQPQPVPKAGWFTSAPPPETHFTVRIPCDARPRVGVDGGFSGNLLIPMLVRDQMSDLKEQTSPETLARAASQIRSVIGSIDAPLVAEFHDIIAGHPSSHMRPLSFAARHQTTSMVTTSQVRFGLYEAEFGFGQPSFVCLTKLFAGAYTMGAFLPTAPDQEPGINVLLTSNTQAMANILKNEYWRGASSLVW